MTFNTGSNAIVADNCIYVDRRAV